MLGLIKGWKYAQQGYLLLILDSLYLSMNKILLIVLLLLVLYMVMFLALRYVIKNTKWGCFVASAISCLPFFLLWGYTVNRSVYSTFFEWESIVLNLKVGIGFVLLWLLASVGLFIWTKSRILKTQPVNIRLLSSLLGIVLVFNVSMYLFYNFHTVKKDSPNVLFILVDCLGAGHLSSYGYSRNTTPNIDEFSKDAVIFSQAISQSTFTKTSIASLFTSLYPYQHGVYRGSGEVFDALKGTLTTDTLGNEETTLAEVLLRNGFLTTAWVHQGQISSYMGFSQGFVDYHERPGGIDSTNTKFMKWAKRIGKKVEFFAYIHYLDLHSPYRPKPPYDTLYVSKAGEDKRDSNRFDYPRALYDGQLTYIDTEIGTLLDNLKKEGLYDNTLIILAADHGDAFGLHGSIGHSKAPYDEVIRVPLIIKFPKSSYAGKVVKNQVRLIDVMPTILDFLNIKIDGRLEGFSLLTYIDNKDRNNKNDFPKYAISEIYNKVLGIDSLSIRTVGFKYIHFRNKGDELYDLKADPEEKNNIIELKPSVAEEFRQMLPPILSAKNQKRVKQATLDKKTIEELKALGYIQ